MTGGADVDSVYDVVVPRLAQLRKHEPLALTESHRRATDKDIDRCGLSTRGRKECFSGKQVGAE
jgi:hypothetical protein